MGEEPYYFAVTRLHDNRLNGLMREIAELIDLENDPDKLYDMRMSLHILGDGARSKGWRINDARMKRVVK